MDGTKAEDQRLKEQLVSKGILIPLPKYENCYLARTDPNVSQLSFIFPLDRYWLEFFKNSDLICKIPTKEVGKHLLSKIVFGVFIFSSQNFVDESRTLSKM